MWIFLPQNKKKSDEIDGSDKELVAEAERLDIKDKAVLAVAEVLFDEKILQQIPKYRTVLLRVRIFGLWNRTVLV